MRQMLALFAPVAVAGLIVGGLAWRDRDRDPAFAISQQQLRSLEPKVLEDSVRKAPEPVPGNDGRPGLSARCTPSPTGGLLRNPWRCTVRYRNRHVIRYEIRVQPNGEYEGESPGGTRSVFGVATP